MSTDFLAGVSADLLNTVASTIYPKIEDKLSGSGTVSSYKFKYSWKISAPPVFNFSQSGTDNFTVDLTVDITITPEDGGKSDTANVPTVAAATASVSGAGNVTFSVKDMTFSTKDPYLSEVLVVEKPAIIGQVQNILSAIKIPISHVEGTSFTHYAVEIVDNALNIGATISGGASISSSAPTGSGLGIVFSNELMQNIVRNVWWNSASKSFRPNSDTTIDINGYGFSVSGGKLNLSLNLGGRYELDEGLGTAKWDIRIGTVYVQLNISIDSSNNVNLEGGSVSTPSVDFHPDNFLATVTSIATDGIINIIADSVIRKDIPDQVRDHLNGSIYTIPDVTSSIDGVNFTIKPEGLALRVNGSEVDVTGSATVSA